MPSLGLVCHKYHIDKDYQILMLLSTPIRKIHIRMFSFLFFFRMFENK